MKKSTRNLTKNRALTDLNREREREGEKASSVYNAISRDMTSARYPLLLVNKKEGVGSYLSVVTFKGDDVLTF